MDIRFEAMAAIAAVNFLGDAGRVAGERINPYQIGKVVT